MNTMTSWKQLWLVNNSQGTQWRSDGGSPAGGAQRTDTKPDAVLQVII